MNTLCFDQTFDDINMELEYRECALAVERAMHETACILDNYDQLMFMEATGDSSDDKAEPINKKSNGLIGGIMKAFQTIIDKIRKVLDSFFEGVKQTFGNQKQMTKDDYMNSETAQVRFSTDIQKVQKDIDREYIHARKLVRMIASHTPLSEQQVADFLDGTTDMLHKHGPAVLKTTVAVSVGVALRKVAKSMKSLTDEAEDAVKDMNTADSTQVKLAQRVLNGIFSMAGTVLKLDNMRSDTINTLSSNAAKYDRKNRRAEKKQAKKGMK